MDLKNVMISISLAISNAGWKINGISESLSMSQGTFFDHYISINLFYIFNDFWYWFESLRNSLLFILSSYGLEGYYVKSCNLKVSAVFAVSCDL